jgi:hypothetical protein
MALLILGIENGIGSHTLTVGLAKIGEALKVRAAPSILLFSPNADI